MSTPGGSGPWPGSVDGRDDWLRETVGELAHLGFELRDGSLPGTHPGPRLLVGFRNHPTLDHFDPEEVTYWEARDGRGHLVMLDRDAEVPSSRPWSWGPIHVTDRIPVSNQFLGFGGTLLVDVVDGVTTYAS